MSEAKKAREKAHKRGEESQLLGGATVPRAFELFSAFTAASGLHGAEGAKPGSPRLPPPGWSEGVGVGTKQETHNNLVHCANIHLKVEEKLPA